MAADWSASFAGIAAVISILGLIYSVRQHRENVRREFILWALAQMQSPVQRENRRFLFYLNQEENYQKKQRMVTRIRKGKGVTLKNYGKIREAFALFDHIGYFWAHAGYGNLGDIKALFPQIERMWEIAQDYIDVIRSRPNQSTSHPYYEELAVKLKKVK